jgi:uncharacterized RDD family membrane protein YckC
MSAADPSLAPSKKPSYRRTRSLINLRGSALILDGLVLFIPLLVADYVLSRAFPHRGFFWAGRRSSGFNTGLGAPGVLMATALAFTYFFVMEATRGQTIGKRYYAIRVQSASGGPASANAISGRTVLRLIDALPILYLVGTLVAILSGARRRRIGDWAAGTVVVREDETYIAPAPAPSAVVLPSAQSIVNAFVAVQATPTGMPSMTGRMPPMAGTPASSAAPSVAPPTSAGAISAQAHRDPARASGWDWRVPAYPLAWIAAVLIATFALGLGKAEGASEEAITLVREYVQARQDGNATLACSLLTPGQQRELVAIQSREYGSATSNGCPRYILESEARSHLLSPELGGFVAAEPTIVSASPTAVVVGSSADPNLQLIAVAENGTFKLDMRGIQRIEFVAGCERSSPVSAEQCTCTFDRLRAEGPLPEGPQQITTAWRQRAQEVAEQCGGVPGAGAQ